MPLSLDEAASVNAAKGKPLRDAKTAAHYAHRVELTMAGYIEQIQKLFYELSAMTERAKNRAGTASTLSPLDAVRYLTDDQRKAIFDGLMRDQYERRVRAAHDAEAHTAALSALRARVEAALAAATAGRADPDELAGLLAALDVATPTVTDADAPPAGDDVVVGDRAEGRTDDLAALFGDDSNTPEVRVEHVSTTSAQPGEHVVSDLAELFGAADTLSPEQGAAPATAGVEIRPAGGTDEPATPAKRIKWSRSVTAPPVAPARVAHRVDPQPSRRPGAADSATTVDAIADLFDPTEEP